MSGKALRSQMAQVKNEGLSEGLRSGRSAALSEVLAMMRQPPESLIAKGLDAMDSRRPPESRRAELLPAMSAIGAALIALLDKP